MLNLITALRFGKGSNHVWSITTKFNNAMTQSEREETKIMQPLQGGKARVIHVTIGFDFSLLIGLSERSLFSLVNFVARDSLTNQKAYIKPNKLKPKQTPDYFGQSIMPRSGGREFVCFNFSFEFYLRCRIRKNSKKRMLY